MNSEFYTPLKYTLTNTAKAVRLHANNVLVHMNKTLGAPDTATPTETTNNTQNSTASNETGRFARLARNTAGVASSVAQVAAFIGALAGGMNEANADKVIYPGDEVTCKKGEKVSCEYPAPSKGNGKKNPPTPPHEVPPEDEPSDMNMRTPNISHATYYTELLNGAKVPNSKGDKRGEEYVQFDNKEDTARFFIKGSVNTCIEAIGKVDVVQQGKNGPYVVDGSEKNWALSLSVQENTFRPAAQTVKSDNVREQPIQQYSVRTKKDSTITGWTTNIVLDPTDAVQVKSDEIRILTIHPQEVEGSTTAYPIVMRLTDCDNPDNFKHVQKPEHVAAVQLPVNKYYNFDELNIHARTRPTPDADFKSGYKLEMQADIGRVQIPAGGVADISRFGSGLVNSFGQVIPDHFVKGTIQYGSANNVPSTLVVMNNPKAPSPELSRIQAGVHPTAWSFETQPFDPNTCTDTGCNLHFTRVFPPKDNSTGKTLDVTATVNFNGGELTRTRDLKPAFVGTKTATIGEVTVEQSEYDVNQFVSCTGIGNTLVCVNELNAGNETTYEVCGAGVDQQTDGGKARMYHLHCGADMYNKN